MHRLVKLLPAFEQEQFLDTTVSVLAGYLGDVKNDRSEQSLRPSSRHIAASGLLLHRLMSEDDMLKDHLVTWLTRLAGGGVGETVNIRRMAFAALSQDEGK
jgi:telomere length regulation protein